MFSDGRADLELLSRFEGRIRAPHALQRCWIGAELFSTAQIEHHRRFGRQEATASFSTGTPTALPHSLHEPS